MSLRLRGVVCGAAAILALAGAGEAHAQQAARPARYEDLVALFREWREFQHARAVNGVPDYTATAMAAQRRGLLTYQRRLTAMDTARWTRPQQTDYRILQAELNGMDFDQRVLVPWTRNPAFYVTVFPEQSDQPAREGPHADGAVELWRYTFPLSATAAAEIGSGLRVIPGLLQQARTNLTGNAHDLWTMGIRSVREQSAALAALAAQLGDNAALVGAARSAQAATDAFRAWLESQAPAKTGPSGIGIANYDWYLKHVQQLPYTWQDEVTLMRRELGRARAALALEEQRNRNLAPLSPVASDAEWQRGFNAAVSEYVSFLREHGILTVRDYMEPALRARGGHFAPGPREFFNEVSYRDPIVMRTHDFHWIDLARLEREPPESPLRRSPLLYNIFTTRTEGFATALEEMMMQAGFLDTHPRAREMIYILVAERAARALGDLMMQANRYTIAQSVKFVSSETPRGWLREDGSTVWGEQHLYLQQPTYGTSYLMGKIEIERLLGDRARQQGSSFTLQSFLDEFTALGLIPISLIRFQLMGAE